VDNIIDQINQILAGYLPQLIGALAILVLGWLVARIVAAIVRSALRRTNLDNRLAQWLMGEAVAVEDGVARGVGFDFTHGTTQSPAQSDICLRSPTHRRRINTVSRVDSSEPFACGRFSGSWRGKDR